MTPPPRVSRCPAAAPPNSLQPGNLPVGDAGQGGVRKPGPRFLAGASERLREAGGRFPGRPGRPRRGDTSGYSAPEVPEKEGENPRPLPISGCAPMPPRLLDLAGAAAYLSVSPWVIRDLEHAGRLRRVRLDLGERDVRRVLYDKADLDGLIEGSKA